MNPKIMSEPDVKTEQESQLIALYRALPAAERQAVLRYFMLLRRTAETVPEKNAAE